MSNGGRIAKNFLGGILSHDEHVARFDEIRFFEVTAKLNVEFPHVAIRVLHRLRPHRDDSIAHLAREIVVSLRAHSANDRHLIADRLQVFILVVHPFAGALASYLHAGLATPQQDDVVADPQERAQDALSHALSVAEQQHHRGDAPHDPEHCQR